MLTAALPAALAMAVPAQMVPPAATPDPSSVILDRNRVDRTPPATLPAQTPAPQPLAPAPAAVANGRSDVTIRSIQFSGTRVPAVVARAAERFVGRKADRATLGALAQAMSEAYARADVALYTVAVPQQDFANGVVNLLVMEGHVEAVRIEGDERDRDTVIALAARIKAEKPLSRATLERSLSLMRDIPGMTLDAQLLTGREAGGVILVLKIGHKKRPNIEFSFDNRTSRVLDEGQFTATARTFGLLRDGDETSIIAAAGVNFKSFRYLAATHSTPLGDQGLRLGFSAATLTTRPKRTNQRGDAQVAGISLSYPLIRSYATNLIVSASLDGLDSDNAVLGSVLTSEHTRAARLAAGFSVAKPKRSVTAGVTVSRGLDILDARVIAPLAETEFTKVNAKATLDQAIGKRLVGRLRFSGQWSNDRLPAGERLVVGGEEFGRAFENAVLTGDRGVAGLAELAWRPLRGKTFEATELYGFVDKAKLRLVARGLFTGANYDLASAAGGIRLAYTQKAALTLEAAKAIDSPYPWMEKDWRLSIGWRFDLQR